MKGEKKDSGKFPAFDHLAAIESNLLSQIGMLGQLAEGALYVPDHPSAWLAIERTMPMELVADVLDFGAEKYSWDNWKKVPDGLARYRNACFRHLLFPFHYPEDLDGLDKESGLPHLAHAACCAKFVVWFLENGEQDDE